MWSSNGDLNETVHADFLYFCSAVNCNTAHEISMPFVMFEFNSLFVFMTRIYCKEYNS